MATFWAFALGLALSLYVLLDGFDLGVGILFAFAPNERARRHMMQAVSRDRDGNETWLVVSGGVLFAAFPAAYAILVGAFYLPVIVMLCGLILRGVAFEFRDVPEQESGRRHRHPADHADRYRRRPLDLRRPLSASRRR